MVSLKTGREIWTELSPCISHTHKFCHVTVLTGSIPESLEEAILQVSLFLFWSFVLGGLSSPLQCPVCVCISTATLTLCTCTQILTLTVIISIRPVQINIFVRKTTFSVSAPLLSGLRHSISDVDSFLVFWILFPPVAVTVSSVLTFTLAAWQLVSPGHS